MEQKQDILANGDLKKMPFTVPEGYFENLSAKMAETARQDCAAESRVARPLFLQKVSTYLSIAASFAIIAAAGTYIVKTFTPKQETSSLEAMEWLEPETDPEAMYYYSQNTSGALTDEELIEYLIESGVTLEELNEQTQE